MTNSPTTDQPKREFSPSNWANQALLKMDVANILCTHASVSMDDVERYNRASAAFWEVARMLAAERERIELTQPSGISVSPTISNSLVDSICMAEVGSDVWHAAGKRERDFVRTRVRKTLVTAFAIIGASYDSAKQGHGHGGG